MANISAAFAHSEATLFMFLYIRMRSRNYCAHAVQYINIDSVGEIKGVTSPNRLSCTLWNHSFLENRGESRHDSVRINLQVHFLYTSYGTIRPNRSSTIWRSIKLKIHTPELDGDTASRIDHWRQGWMGNTCMFTIPPKEPIYCTTIVSMSQCCIFGIFRI